MKTAAGSLALAFVFATNLFAAQKEGCKPAKEPTKAEKSDKLVAKMEQMRDDYQELLAECWGKGYYLDEGRSEGPVWHLADAPNAKSCKKAEALKDDYRGVYKKLLKLDRKRALFDDIPKYIDRN
jgi:hypothetical protein